MLNYFAATLSLFNKSKFYVCGGASYPGFQLEPWGFRCYCWTEEKHCALQEITDCLIVPVMPFLTENQQLMRLYPAHLRCGIAKLSLSVPLVTLIGDVILVNQMCPKILQGHIKMAHGVQLLLHAQSKQPSVAWNLSKIKLLLVPWPEHIRAPDNYI